MSDIFLEYLKPILWLCNIFGFTSLSCNNALQKVVSHLFFPGLCLIMTFAMTTTSTTTPDGVYYFTNLVNIVNKLGVCVGALNICARGIYYRINRKTIHNLILEVIMSLFYYKQI